MAKNRNFKIKPAIALEMGLALNPSNQYRITTEQIELYYQIKARQKGDSVDSNDLDNESVTETNQYETQRSPVLSARKADGTIMTVEEYCKTYGLDHTNIKSSKLVTHTGVPYYNLASKSASDEDDITITLDELKSLISEDLSRYKYVRPTKFGTTYNVDVVKIADLHFGAYIDGLVKTKDYSIQILADRLNEAAQAINERGAALVHVHILGDLIESFTGLNHKNSWKGLQKGMIGAEAVKLCASVLHKEFLSKITNLGEVKIIAGNHDRVTSDNNEDTDGGAADLIAWGLKLIGYSVEFNPFVITHVVDNICHILMHGDKPISKKSTKDICWDYGKQNMFNLVCEGHLHSIIEKLALKQRSTFQTISDDSVDHRRMYCPSFFTGNSFSEYLGYTSQAGFVITRNNGKGVPNVHYMAL